MSGCMLRIPRFNARPAGEEESNPMHVSMPRELKSRPGTSPTHPGRCRAAPMRRPIAFFRVARYPLCAKPTARGLEPLRAEPNGFLVHHLNHSVTLSQKRCETRSRAHPDLNQGPADLQSAALTTELWKQLQRRTCRDTHQGVGAGLEMRQREHSSVVRAADCRSAGP